MTKRGLRLPRAQPIAKAEFKEDELAKARREIAELRTILAETTVKIQYLINYLPLPEGHFTFPDGDTWVQTKKEPKP